MRHSYPANVILVEADDQITLLVHELPKITNNDPLLFLYSRERGIALEIKPGDTPDDIAAAWFSIACEYGGKV